MRKVIGLGLLCLSNQTLAQFNIGVDLAIVEQDVIINDSKFEPTISTLIISGGYTFNLTESLSITPEIGYGIGINEEDFNIGSSDSLEDILSPVDVELDSVIRISSQFSYKFSKDFSVFVAPTMLFTDFSADKYSLEDEDSDFGADIGGEYNFSKSWAIQGAIGVYQDSDFGRIGIRYKF